MEPFILAGLVAERRARREREAKAERLRRRPAAKESVCNGTSKHCPGATQPVSRPTSA